MHILYKVHVLKYYNRIIQSKDKEIRSKACFNLPAIFDVYPLEDSSCEDPPAPQETITPTAATDRRLDDSSGEVSIFDEETKKTSSNNSVDYPSSSGGGIGSEEEIIDQSGVHDYVEPKIETIVEDES